MKCKYCDEEMIESKTNYIFVCPHCGTDLIFDSNLQEIVWTIEKYKDNIKILNNKNNILKQL